MSDPYRPHTLPADEARRRRRLTLIVGLVLIGCIIAGLVWARWSQANNGPEASLAKGSEALIRGLRGEDGAFDRAEGAFRRASRASVVDHYPAFAATVAGRLGRGEPADANPQVSAVLSCVAESDVACTEKALDRIGNPSLRQWVRRLISVKNPDEPEEK